MAAPDPRSKAVTTSRRVASSVVGLVVVACFNPPREAGAKANAQKEARPPQEKQREANSKNWFFMVVDFFLVLEIVCVGCWGVEQNTNV